MEKGTPFNFYVMEDYCPLQKKKKEMNVHRISVPILIDVVVTFPIKRLQPIPWN